MDAIEKIQIIRNMNIIEETMGDYNQTQRNEKMADGIGRVDFSNLTKEQAQDLGFGCWSEENPIYLIPMYLYDYLEYGQTLESISGRKKVVGLNYQDPNSENYIDDDSRFGMLAYGFYPKEA